MSKKSGIRAFIAFEIAEEAKDAIEDVQFDLMDIIPEENVNWVKNPNMHLTLFFLGDGVLPNKIPPLCDGLDQIGSQNETVQLVLNQIDAFPSRRDPRVLWVGLQGNIKILKGIKSEIDTMLKPMGWMPEKRGFTPMSP